MEILVKVDGLSVRGESQKAFPDTATIGAVVEEFQKREPMLQGLFFQGRLQPAATPLRQLSHQQCTFSAYLRSDEPGLEPSGIAEDEAEEAALRLDGITVNDISPSVLQRVLQFMPGGLKEDHALVALWYVKCGKNVEAMERFVRSIPNHFR
jgi:hypothetical protein